jgi:hypothetical protein
MRAMPRPGPAEVFDFIVVGAGADPIVKAVLEGGER